MPRPRDLPSRARIVIVGGGVGGASIAYHLAKLGERDVVLLDRNELTSGSTFHSAGLVGQLRSSVSLTTMMMYSAELYRELSEECGWVECGGIRLACTPEREQETRRQVAWARTFGLPLDLISPSEAHELFPLMDLDGVRCASYLATDGYLDPSQLTYALAAGAREGGVQIFTHTRVTGIDVRDNRVRGIATEWGDIECEVVVDAGGMFAAEIGRMAGVRVPVVPFAHEYVVTQPFRERGDGTLPTMRDPDLLVYFREEGGGLVWGGYERDSAPWALDEHDRDRIPADFNGRLLDEDWERFEEIAVNAARRIPALADVPVTKLINGPEAFTPDNEFCLGESDVRGFFVAAGFCAHGLAGAGGVGKVMASWIADGEAPIDLWPMDVRRFGAHHRSPSYTLKRAKEVYETYYDIRYPGHERQAGRPLRVSSAYDWHTAHGASFGEKSGWERVNYYESNAAAGDESLRPHGWAGRNWSPAIGAEALACRERAALFDESSFAKIDVVGPGAAALLDDLCERPVARDIGRITYTQMLNRRGGVECDLTVARVEEDVFSIVTGTAFGAHDRAWIERHVPADGSVRVVDVTARSACFALWGPLAREILAPLTPDALDFPYMTLREITVGDVPVRAVRVTYVGELGWELYCPAEYGAGLWRALFDTGRPHGLVAGGYRAIEALRLEKGYRVWGADVTADDTPAEAFGGSQGDRADSAGRRLRCLVLDDPHAVALGNEPVRIGDGIAGRVTSGGYGYAVRRSIAYAYLPADVAEQARVAVDVFGEWVPATVTREPLYDPEGVRVRA
ncbi:MAG TPA: FAD-dependent oxidoreductase [Solirubrobacteraceae bacterium]|nr:FAD-dependent oxidoreductase [Solirubrobacteraceae bacterium]